MKRANLRLQIMSSNKDFIRRPGGGCGSLLVIITLPLPPDCVGAFCFRQWWDLSDAEMVLETPLVCCR